MPIRFGYSPEIKRGPPVGLQQQLKNTHQIGLAAHILTLDGVIWMEGPPCRCLHRDSEGHSRGQHWLRGDCAELTVCADVPEVTALCPMQTPTSHPQGEEEKKQRGETRQRQFQCRRYKVARESNQSLVYVVCES